MPGEPGETRDTPYGRAVRGRDSWTWTCRFCERTVILGLLPDVQGFDSQRWLDAIDSSHRCLHKPDGGAPDGGRVDVS